MKCPVCEGKGVVPVKHPPDTPDWIKKTKFEREPCKVCNGCGEVTREKFDDYHNHKGRKAQEEKSYDKPD